MADDDERDREEGRWNNEGGAALDPKRQEAREEQEAKEARELEAMRKKASKK